MEEMDETRSMHGSDEIVRSHISFALSEEEGRV